MMPSVEHVFHPIACVGGMPLLGADFVYRCEADLFMPPTVWAVLYSFGLVLCAVGMFRGALEGGREVVSKRARA